MANLILLLTILMEDKVWYHISFAYLWEPLGILEKKKVNACFFSNEGELGEW